MGFAGVYRAVYGYSASGEQELSLKENDLLYLLETADDGWWTVKKRVPGAASEEPQGIVPHNYIEPAVPEKNAARALYSYDRQTDEELSFSDGTVFNIYATDGDWVLVGVQGGNEFGFVPKNYIETISSGPPVDPAPAPAAAQGSGRSQPDQHAPTAFPPPAQPTSGFADFDADEPEERAPPRPSRPGRRPTREALDRDLPDEPQGRDREDRDREDRESAREEPKHLTWPLTDISGRRRIAKTLVVASTYVTLINDDGGGKTQKWDVQDIKSYSSEKKHVFLDLENPTASLELKASSQAEADRIISSLGQIVGAGRGGGLDEVLTAAKSAGLKQGQIVLDFRAANSKELSVTEFETVFVINESDKDWWLVRNVSGREGLVPRKFVHLDRKDGKLSDLFKNKRQRERQRERDLEKDHLSARRSAHDISRVRSNSAHSGSSHSNGNLSRSKSTRSSRGDRSSRSLPDARKVRLWVDRTGTFRVDAQLLGCSDGKVHLHKANGVKIAVPASKLSLKDVEYVESVTGVNLGDDKPLDDPPSSHSRNKHLRDQTESRSAREATNAKDDGWLSFFLECGVDPQNANRYAKNFTRDNMDESSLADINASVLRTLGLREGDILRVTKKVNEKLGRVQNPEGGLYSTGGALQNNTGTTPAEVDNKVWSQPQQSPPAQSPPSQPAMQPSLQPQPTAAASRPAQSSQPTGALADLLGVAPTGQQPQTPALTGAPTGQLQALQAQKTAEAQLASQQRQTQHQILRQQAELQKEQIRLLKQQQDQLRRQQDELVQIQRTGTQLQALGPFATGVAQRSSFAPTAASVLSAPAPPVSRALQPMQPAQATGFSGVQSGMPTGPSTSFGQPMAASTTGGLPQQITGPFAQQPQQPQQPHTTGPFANGMAQQRTGPFVQSQPTGPFAQQQTTGSFTTAPTTPQPFPQQQQPTSGPLTSFGAAPTGQLGGLSLTGQRTGPFQSTAAPSTTSFQQPGAFQNQATGPFQNQATGPFQSQTTGPFQGQTTGAFQNSAPAAGAFGQTTGSVPGSMPGSLPGSNTPSTFQTTGLFQGANPSTTGPFQSQATGPFQSQPQPFSSQPTSSFPSQPPQSFPSQQSYGAQPQPFASQATGPFQSQPQSQQSQPFQGQSFPSQATGPFSGQPGAQQAMTTFGNQFQLGQQRTGPFAQPQPTNQFSQPTNQFAQPPNQFAQPPNQFAQPSQFAQATGPFQQQNQFPQSTFGQPAMNPTNPIGQQATQAMPQMGQTPLQSQATGFGFGNQPQPSQQPVRANFSVASASNPFGL